jgi:DtxR family Mn-dependent transcriptional regulator
MKTVRRHRLWEMFLVKFLAYSWDEIHDEAELLEHITSEELEQRLDKALGYPKVDPHGDPIPSQGGKLTETPSRSLDAVQEGKTVIVQRVNDSNPEILRYASRLGIALNQKIKVKERVSFDGSLRVRVGGQERFISSKLAQNVFVDEK